MLCRLCINDQDEFKNLYNDLGEGNEIYDITVQYFDPMVNEIIFSHTNKELNNLEWFCF